MVILRRKYLLEAPALIYYECWKCTGYNISSDHDNSVFTQKSPQYFVRDATEEEAICNALPFMRVVYLPGRSVVTSLSTLEIYEKIFIFGFHW